MTGAYLAWAAIGITLLIDGIAAASLALGRRDDLNFPVSPLLAGGGENAARAGVPCVALFPPSSGLPAARRNQPAAAGFLEI